MLPTYIPKLRMKIRVHHSLLETLMDIHSFGGLMVTTAEGREIEIFFPVRLKELFPVIHPG